jgi:hypothetical protein
MRPFFAVAQNQFAAAKIFADNTSMPFRHNVRNVTERIGRQRVFLAEIAIERHPASRQA